MTAAPSWVTARSSAPCCSVSPLRVGVRVLDGVWVISWVGASLEWPAYHLVPPSVAPTSVGHLRDLSGAKVKISEGFVAKSLSIEIVHVVFARFSGNARAFLQECACTQGFLAAGRLACVGRCRVGHTAGRHALARARCVACGPCWAEISLAFSRRLEIAFHFNSELNFCN